MEKILVIYNPVAGKDSTRPADTAVRDLFPAPDYEVTLYRTKCTGDATSAVLSMGAEYDIIVACGGDGTLNETVNGILKAGLDVPVGYIPMGTTNDFASTLKIPRDYREAVSNIKAGHINEYDVGVFNDGYFNYVSCFGPGASVSYATNQKFKNKLGYPAYIINGFVFNAVPILASLKARLVRVEYDDSVYEGRVYFGAISNSTSVAGMFKFQGQHIVLNDGKFELLLVKKFPLAKAFPLVINVLKGNYEDENIIFVKAENVKITFTDSVPWTLDGEFGGDQTDVNFSVKKRAIKIFSPVNELFEEN